MYIYTLTALIPSVLLCINIAQQCRLELLISKFTGLLSSRWEDVSSHTFKLNLSVIVIKTVILVVKASLLIWHRWLGKTIVLVTSIKVRNLGVLPVVLNHLLHLIIAGAFGTSEFLFLSFQGTRWVWVRWPGWNYDSLGAWTLKCTRYNFGSCKTIIMIWRSSPYIPCNWLVMRFNVLNLHFLCFRFKNTLQFLLGLH